jgi:hypothetical protein
VNVDEDGRAFSRRVEVHVLGEGGAERHVEAVGEILSRPLALPPAERLVEEAASGKRIRRSYWASSSSWVAKSR